MYRALPKVSGDILGFCNSCHLISLKKYLLPKSKDTWALAATTDGPSCAVTFPGTQMLPWTTYLHMGGNQSLWTGEKIFPDSSMRWSESNCCYFSDGWRTTEAEQSPTHCEVPAHWYVLEVAVSPQSSSLHRALPGTAADEDKINCCHLMGSLWWSRHDMYSCPLLLGSSLGIRSKFQTLKCCCWDVPADIKDSGELLCTQPVGSVVGFKRWKGS